MEKIYALLAKQWDILYEIQSRNFNDTKNINEGSIALDLGLIILNNNLKTLNNSDLVRSQIVNKYRQLFNIDATPSLEITFNMLISPYEFDFVGSIYEEHIHNNGTRKSSGQFYSPYELVDHMVTNLNISSDADLDNKKFIDIACGTGIFLLGAMNSIVKILRSRGYSDQNILSVIQNNIYGLDINPISCLITQINMFNYLVLNLSPDSIIDASAIKFNIYESNSIENRYDLTKISSLAEDMKIKNRIGTYQHGFDYIVGNPPYLEAKKMPRDLKAISKENFPDIIFGATDLYIAFIGQCNRLVADNGMISLILPNKFMVAKYGMKVRKYILENFKILHLDDLSEMDIFHKADVYPIVISYKNEPPAFDHTVATKISVQNYKELADNVEAAHVEQSLYLSLGNLITLFCLPNKGSFEKTFKHLFKDSKPISNYLTFRSTVSFHKTGLREQFIFTNLDPYNKNTKKYLGGRSYSSKNEVSKFSIDWEGFYINYDQDELRSVNNVLPPLSNFEQEKIIFCQHAREINATFDQFGEWVTKDVYPIAFKSDANDNTSISVKCFTGLLNSKLFSFIYGIIYKGIQISAGYYHYLPTWMGILPIITLQPNVVLHIESLVDLSIACSNEEKRSIYLDEIDQIIFNAYAITKEQQDVINNFFKK